jgi:predicted Rossmann-fold nucleotide-binding protein
MARASYDPFAGTNQSGVFEDLGELISHVENYYGSWDNVPSMEGWVFQEVDFSSLGAELFTALPVKGANFWGCIFPSGVSDDDVRRMGASYVMTNPTSLPFKPLRAFLYNQEELRQHDAEIYKFFKSESSVSSRMAFSLHDFSIMDALLDFAEGKTFVAVMGGHKVKRNDDAYADLVRLGLKIADAGFVCATGGGPGAMEACNLGAYLASHRRRRDSVTDLDDSSSDSVAANSDIQKALELIRAPVDGFVGDEMLNITAARRVIDYFGAADAISPSLGIPTWVYGHEPSNIFAGYHAKFFSNAVREDILLDICFGGLIIGPGGPGTFQEVFQACCKNAYCKPGKEYPMVFFGKKFWTDCGVWDVVVQQAKGRPYADLLLISDDIDEIVNHIYMCACRKGYRLLSDWATELGNPYWYSRDKISNASDS